MRAIVQVGYGSPDVLKLQEIERPLVDDNRVLVRDPRSFGERRRLARDAKALARTRRHQLAISAEEGPDKRSELGICRNELRAADTASSTAASESDRAESEDAAPSP